MRLKAYCPLCGNFMIIKKKKDKYLCDSCYELIRYECLVTEFTLEQRMNQIVLMDNLIHTYKNEDVHLKWSYVVPDNMTEDNVFYIALKESHYMKCIDTFLALVSNMNRLSMRW